MAGDYTDFWLACATAGPVLLIPTYEMVRRRQMSADEPRAGITEASVALLGTGALLALTMLSGGTPVGGSRVGRVIEIALIGGLVIALAIAALRGRAQPGR